MNASFSNVSNPDLKTDIMPTYMSWLVCFIASLFFFYEFIQMNMFNAISAPLRYEFHLNATGISTLSAIYFYSNVLFLLPAGIILDRVSTRKIVLIALSICVAGTFLFAVSNSVWLIGVCRFFTAIGSAFCFLSCIRLATRWFPARKLALVSGLVVTMAMLGGMVAQAPLAFLVLHFGWRHALMLDAALGVIILILIALIVKDYPAGHQDSYQEQKQQLSSLGYWRSMRLSFLRLQNWLCGIYTSTLNLPIFVLGSLWGVSYLVHVKGVAATSAPLVTSMLFLGTIVGAPIAGWLSDQIGLRRVPMFGGAILSLVVMTSIIFLNHLALFNWLLLFFLLGFISSTQVISYPTVAESNMKLLTATSVSVVSICAISGGAIFQPVFGALMDWHWHGLIQNGIRVYSPGDYQFAAFLFLITFVVGFLVVCGLRETHCRHMDDH